VDAGRSAAATLADVVLVDLGSPDNSGAALIRDAAVDNPGVDVIAIVPDTERANVLRAFQAGAAGVLHRDAGAEEVKAAVHAVADGGVFLCPVLAREVVEAYLRTIESGDTPSDTLTPRQRQVLQMVARGLTTKEIARELGLSVKTNESHRSDIMRRLGVRQMAGLVREAVRMGLIGEGF